MFHFPETPPPSALRMSHLAAPTPTTMHSQEFQNIDTRLHRGFDGRGDPD